MKSPQQAALPTGRDSPARQDIRLDDREFNEIRRVIREMTGINMGESKRQLVFRRVGMRLKATGIATFADYLDFLRTGDEHEVEQFTNAITTNLTSFFREKHHFDFLAERILPDIADKKRRGSRRLRIWSAGCSTGEEPYSIAMVLRESFRELGSWDARVLCTDLDSAVVATSRAGIYAADRMEKIPEALRRRWFLKSAAAGPERYKASPQLQELLTFKQLNLMHEWPMKGLFDVIFCRNVVIYFDKPTQRTLVERFANVLEPGGYLILGHSESLFKVSDRFELIGNTIYRRTD